MPEVVGSMPRFDSCHFLINLWCSFCPLLYIFCAEEFQPIILILKSCFGTINDKAVNPSTVIVWIQLKLMGLTMMSVGLLLVLLRPNLSATRLEVTVSEQIKILEQLFLTLLIFFLSIN